MSNKTFFILSLILIILLSPKISLAQNTGEVSLDKTKNSILGKIPQNITESFFGIIEWAESERKDLNIYAEKEILKIKTISNSPDAKHLENSGETGITNNGLGDPSQIFLQVKYYLFWILVYITSQAWLFWAIAFILFFAVVRTILRIIF